MTTRRIHIHLTPDGYSLRSQGVDPHQVRNLIKLAGRCPERLRSYIGVALNVVPDVTVSRPVVDPPSGVELVAGEDVS